MSWTVVFPGIINLGIFFAFGIHSRSDRSGVLPSSDSVLPSCHGTQPINDGGAAARRQF